jgi:hypothetical protein
MRCLAMLGDGQSKFENHNCPKRLAVRLMAVPLLAAIRL